MIKSFSFGLTDHNRLTKDTYDYVYDVKYDLNEGKRIKVKKLLLEKFQQPYSETNGLIIWKKVVPCNKNERVNIELDKNLIHIVVDYNKESICLNRIKSIFEEIKNLK